MAQAAEVIGLGRTKTYQLARNAADNGVGPFPAVRFGKQLRIPRRKLEALSGGPITLQLDDDTASTTSHDEPDPTNNTDHPPTTTHSVDTPTDLQQQPLPFTE